MPTGKLRNDLPTLKARNTDTTTGRLSNDVVTLDTIKSELPTGRTKSSSSTGDGPTASIRNTD